MELDLTSSSLQEWSDRAAAHAFVYDARSAKALAEGVLAAGFVEPLTGTEVWRTKSPRRAARTGANRLPPTD